VPACVDIEAHAKRKDGSHLVAQYMLPFRYASSPAMLLADKRCVCVKIEREIERCSGEP
jgi:hypothetical protein